MCTPVGPRDTALSPRAHPLPSPQQQANGNLVHVLYSTPACYIWELNKANLTWYLGVPRGGRGLARPAPHDPALSARAGR